MCTYVYICIYVCSMFGVLLFVCMCSDELHVHLCVYACVCVYEWICVSTFVCSCKYMFKCIA